MTIPLFVELTTGQTAVHVSIRARVEAAALCSELQGALQSLLDHYTRLVASGDAGDWEADGQQQVIAARAALARAKGTAA